MTRGRLGELVLLASLLAGCEQNTASLGFVPAYPPVDHKGLPDYGSPEDRAWLASVMIGDVWITAPDFDEEAEMAWGTDPAAYERAQRKWEFVPSMEWDSGLVNATFLKPYAIIDANVGLLDFADDHPLVAEALGPDCENLELNLGPVFVNEASDPKALTNVAIGHGPIEIYLVDHNQDGRPEKFWTLVRNGYGLYKAERLLQVPKGRYVLPWKPYKGTGKRKTWSEISGDNSALAKVPSELGFTAQIDLESCSYDPDGDYHSNYGTDDVDWQLIKSTSFETLAPTGTILRFLNYRGVTMLMDFKMWRAEVPRGDVTTRLGGNLTFQSFPDFGFSYAQGWWLRL